MVAGAIAVVGRFVGCLSDTRGQIESYEGLDVEGRLLERLACKLHIPSYSFRAHVLKREVDIRSRCIAILSDPRRRCLASLFWDVDVAFQAGEDRRPPHHLGLVAEHLNEGTGQQGGGDRRTGIPGVAGAGLDGDDVAAAEHVGAQHISGHQNTADLAALGGGGSCLHHLKLEARGVPGPLVGRIGQRVDETKHGKLVHLRIGESQARMAGRHRAHAVVDLVERDRAELLDGAAVVDRAVDGLGTDAELFARVTDRAGPLALLLRGADLGFLGHRHVGRRGRLGLRRADAAGQEVGQDVVLGGILECDSERAEHVDDLLAVHDGTGMGGVCGVAGFQGTVDSDGRVRGHGDDRDLVGFPPRHHPDVVAVLALLPHLDRVDPVAHRDIAQDSVPHVLVDSIRAGAVAKPDHGPALAGGVDACRFHDADVIAEIVIEEKGCAAVEPVEVHGSGRMVQHLDLVAPALHLRLGRKGKFQGAVGFVDGRRIDGIAPPETLPGHVAQRAGVGSGVQDGRRCGHSAVRLPVHAEPPTASVAATKGQPLMIDPAAGICQTPVCGYPLLPLW